MANVVFQQRRSFWKRLNVGKVAFINSEIVLNQPFLFCNESVPDNNRRLLYVLHVCLCTCSYAHTCSRNRREISMNF